MLSIGTPDGGSYRRITLSPDAIWNLRNQTLTNLPGYRNTLTGGYNALTSSLGDIRGQLAGNQNAYIQARVNPLLEQGALARGSLLQGLSRRNVFGPLAQQSQNIFENNLARTVGDQRALATSEALNQLLGIDTQQYNAALSNVQALQSLDAAQQAVAAQNLSQELASLGLGQAEISGALQAAGLNLQGAQLNADQSGRLLYALGQGLSGLGNADWSQITGGNGTGYASGALANWNGPLGPG